MALSPNIQVLSEGSQQPWLLVPFFEYILDILRLISTKTLAQIMGCHFQDKGVQDFDFHQLSVLVALLLSFLMHATVLTAIPWEGPHSKGPQEVNSLWRVAKLLTTYKEWKPVTTWGASPSQPKAITVQQETQLRGIRILYSQSLGNTQLIARLRGYIWGKSVV